MSYQVWTQSYGQSRVRLTKVDRDADVHQITELAVDVELDGDFDAAYAEGDDSLVLPADTMKNMVCAFAREIDPGELETFAWTLGCHFVENFDHVSHASVKITETPWNRLVIDGKPHPHAFSGSSTERNTCHAAVTAPTKQDEEPEGVIECGLEGLALLKTNDRVFATTVAAKWVYNDVPDDWRALRERIRATLIREFVARFSPSAPGALREMASAVLDAEPTVEEITLSMPNLPRQLIDLTPFDLDNPNVLFAASDEPHGHVAASVCRERHECDHEHDRHES